MAIENAKLLNVRIKNKYDSYENWASSGLILEAGEIAIAYTTVDVAVDNGTAKHPALLMKVGDGKETFAKLPWLSAKAADVLSVCKNETELTKFVNDVIANAGIASDETMQALAKRVTTAEGAIDALEELVGTDKVADQIAAAIAALNLETTYEKVNVAKGLVDALANGAVKDNADAIAAINNEETGILAQAKNYADGLDSAMNTRVAGLEAKFGDEEGGVKDQIDAAVKIEKERAMGVEQGLEGRLAAVEGDYLKAADKTELEGKITSNANAIELLTNGVSAEEVDGVNDLIQYVKEHGTEVTGMKANIAANTKAISDEEARAKGVEQGLDTRLGTAEGEIDALQADSHTHANKELLDTYTQTEANLADAVAKKHVHANATVLDGISAEKVAAWDAAEQNAKDHADGLNTAMDARMDTVEGIAATAVQNVTAAADGGLKATRAEGSNNIVIAINEALTFVLDCGTSAE